MPLYVQILIFLACAQIVPLVVDITFCSWHGLFWCTPITLVADTDWSYEDACKYFLLWIILSPFMSLLRLAVWIYRKIKQ